ncbi:MAG: hypothetical protein DYG88_18795 [Chloroflexi bacterium CFX4]|nr:hypothetical protein [Chloroflexi bacterium CFX4]
MGEAWRTAQAGEAMHHIVPALHSDFRAIRDILQQHGIHPNSAFNGIGLRQEFHALVHTNTYRNAVLTALRSATNSEQAANVLEQVARKLDRLNGIQNIDSLSLAERRTLVSQVICFSTLYGSKWVATLFSVISMK